MFADGRMSVWNLAADRELWHSDIAGYCHKVSHDNAPDAIGFSPDGRVLATACWADQTFWIQCYDANTGAQSVSRPGTKPPLRDWSSQRTTSFTSGIPKV